MVKLMKSGYGQFCPVAKSAEVLGERWTVLIIRELCVNRQSFSNLRKGLPLISPTLLSNRLKSLERQGVIEREKTTAGIFYHLTAAGEELKPIIMALGIWGQRWARSDLSRQDLDPSLLMWDMHRNIDLSFFPEERRVLHFVFLDYDIGMRFWWLVVEKGNVDICLKAPGYEPDLYIETELKTLTEVWIGDKTVTSALNQKLIRLSGNRELKGSFSHWLGKSLFAEHGPACTPQTVSS